MVAMYGGYRKKLNYSKVLTHYFVVVILTSPLVGPRIVVPRLFALPSLANA